MPEAAARQVVRKLEVQHEAMVYSVAKLAAYLQETLGQKVVAYLAGLNDAKMVGQWIKGTEPKNPLVAHRLRSAYEAARVLDAAYGHETTQAWFFGTNAQLGDVAPAYVLRYAECPEDWQNVAPAAHSFVGAWADPHACLADWVPC